MQIRHHKPGAYGTAAVITLILIGLLGSATGCRRQTPPRTPEPASPITTTLPPVVVTPAPEPPPRSDFTVETYGNFHTLGVILRRPDGVARTDVAAARLYAVRPNGVRRLIDPVWIETLDAYVGSVFDLQPDTGYTLRGIFEAPDGSRIAQQDFTGHTRTEPGRPPVPRQEIHVAPTGDDAAPGTDAQPKRTLAAALAAVEEPGTHIVLREGTYYEGDLFAPPRRGTAGAPLVIRAAPGTRPVIDGSDPTLNRDGWTALGDNYYSRPFTGETMLAAFHNRRTRETFRCYPVPDLKYLKGRHCGEPTPELMSMYVNPAHTNTAFEFCDITAAYHCSGTEMTLWCPDFRPGGEVEMRVAVRGNGIEHGRASHVVYEGLTFRYFAGRAIMVQNSDDVIIRNCTFEFCAVPVGCKGDSNRLLVEGCTFRDDCTRWGLLPKTPQGFDYSAYIETGAVNVFPPYNGRGLVIRDCVIDGLFDGALLVPYVTRPTIATSETDFYRNRIVRVLDDFMELDGFPRNVRVFHNHMERSLTGVSIAQGTDGPTWVLYNVLGRHGDTSVRDMFGPSGYPVKTNGADEQGITGWAFFYHNSMWTEEPRTPAFRVKAAEWKHLVMANNIWYGTHTGWDTYHMAPISPVTLQHDIIWHEDGPLFHRDYGSPKDYQTLADVAASGLPDVQFLTNAIVADPRYVDAAAGDYRLREDSPAIDAGILIPGVNDERFAGAAPDIGALESGLPSPLPAL